MWRSMKGAQRALRGAPGRGRARVSVSAWWDVTAPPGKFADGQAAAARGAQRTTRPQLSTRVRAALRAESGDLYTESFAASRAGPFLPARGHLRGGPPFEAHLPTEQPQAQEDARVPRADALPRRPSGAPRPPRPGPQAPRRLTWPIRDRATFEALARARRHRAGAVTLRFVPGDPGVPPRVAFAVGRSSGSAVTRNRIRRRLRAAIGCSEDRLMPGGSHLFGAGAGAATASFDALVASVRTLLDRVAEPGR